MQSSRRRCARAAAAIAALAIACIAGAANAANQILVGVDSVHFAWTPPTGTPAAGYWVWRSLDGGALEVHSFTVHPFVILPVVAGDQVSIAVAAVAYGSTGALQIGPMSVLSDRIWVVRAPRFPADGSWLLRCATCPELARRSLANASLVEARAPGLLAPWRVLGHARLQSGREQIVWHNTSTGALALWDAQFLSPIPGAIGLGPLAVRGIGGADFDRDGVDEFLLQRTDTGAVSAWGRTPFGFERIAAIAGPPGALLAAAGDFDRDGWIDLLWRDLALGTLDLWDLGADPTSGLPLGTVLSTIRRLASGMASDAEVASTGDYDGDGSLDVLWRFRDGRLGITYLSNGVPLRYVELPALPGDVDRLVVGSVDIDGVPGDEIALQERTSKAISILDPSATTEAVRVIVVHPGGHWKAVGIGS